MTTPNPANDLSNMYAHLLEMNTTEETAEFLRTSHRQILTYCRNGRLSAVKVGRQNTLSRLGN